MNEKHSSQHRSARNLKEIALKSVALKDFAAAEERIMNAESATPSSRASIAMNDSVGFRGQEMGRSKRQKTCDLINVLIKKKVTNISASTKAISKSPNVLFRTQIGMN